MQQRHEKAFKAVIVVIFAALVLLSAGVPAWRMTSGIMSITAQQAAQK